MLNVSETTLGTYSGSVCVDHVTMLGSLKPMFKTPLLCGLDPGLIVPVCVCVHVCEFVCVLRIGYILNTLMNEAFLHCNVTMAFKTLFSLN